MSDHVPDPPPTEIARAAQAAVDDREDTSAPAWLNRFVWTALWKLVAVGLLVALGVAIVIDLRHLISLLVISLFFALAIIPGVEALNRRFGMRRGAAVGIIYLAALAFLIFMVSVMIPAIVEFAAAVSSNAAGWYEQLDEWIEAQFGSELIDSEAAASGTEALLHAVQQWGDNIFGILTSGLGLAFDVLTMAMFTFYFAADFPRLTRSVMRRMPPARQKVTRWVLRTSIEQTGGYFYSRLLLMIVCGGSGFVVMLIVGLPLVYAMPLALFMGFVSVFIPFIGTYIGAAVPILVVIAVQGLVPGLILLGWVLVYQQIENYLLSPRLSSKTMELNGAVAFGGAMAGGAIAGPMGAFMALPVAALITAIAKNTGRTYDVLEDADGDGKPDADGSSVAETVPAPVTEPEPEPEPDAN
ncbi:AI-2E family transporter [uncultured Demequina sp.]|uniref:AI-2E family transporter n=1 Tax=uncultured Demequina sp. TaxID=693499 RepID=UPI0025CBAF9E|nr:AI-2E family transporter [uncultured Demequina sp.]